MDGWMDDRYIERETDWIKLFKDVKIYAFCYYSLPAHISYVHHIVIIHIVTFQTFKNPEMSFETSTETTFSKTVVVFERSYLLLMLTSYSP